MIICSNTAGASTSTWPSNSHAASIGSSGLSEEGSSDTLSTKDRNRVSRRLRSTLPSCRTTSAPPWPRANWSKSVHERRCWTKPVARASTDTISRARRRLSRRSRSCWESRPGPRHAVSLGGAQSFRGFAAKQRKAHRDQAVETRHRLKRHPARTRSTESPLDTTMLSPRTQPPGVVREIPPTMAKARR